MKRIIQKYLQKILGFDEYLFLFSLFTIYTLRFKRNEKDFLYFLKLIPEKGVILDIGANIGIMTAHLGRKFRKSGIIAFEPVPSNIKALKRIIKYFKLSNVKVVETALGNNKGNAEMVIPVVKSVKMQGLSHVMHPEINEFNEGIRFTAPLIRLDDFATDNKFETDVVAIKIDVENYESHVIEGGEELISTYHPLIYAELWDNENRVKCIGQLESLGYKTKVKLKNSLVDFDPRSVKTQNFFFIHKEYNKG